MSLFQKNLLFLRKSNMLTQKEASDLFDTNTDTWSKWEKSRDPKFDKLIEIADHFAVNVERLLCVDIEKEGITEDLPLLPEKERAQLSGLIIKKDLVIEDLTEALNDSTSVLLEVAELLSKLPLKNMEDAGDLVDVMAKLKELKSRGNR